MLSRSDLFALTVLLLLIKVCPALSQDISFNKVTLTDETFSDCKSTRRRNKSEGEGG
jgi:hypothetical protein